MAMTIWISATTTGSSYGATPHVAQLGDLHLNGGAAGFQVGERVRHEQPPSNLAYHYARFQATKKEHSRIVTSRPHTRDKTGWTRYCRYILHWAEPFPHPRFPCPSTTTIP